MAYIHPMKANLDASQEAAMVNVRRCEAPIPGRDHQGLHVHAGAAYHGHWLPAGT
jgi:hypothetical protein